VARLPEYELDIRRRCVRDDDFKAVCADYEEAVAALRRLRAFCGAKDPKAEEYDSLLGELEVEIVAKLKERP
jgi:hypothetical protein